MLLQSPDRGCPQPPCTFLVAASTHIGILIQHEEQPVGAGVNGIAVQLLQHVQQHLLAKTLDGVVWHQDDLLLLLDVCMLSY